VSEDEEDLQKDGMYWEKLANSGRIISTTRMNWASTGMGFVVSEGAHVLRSSYSRKNQIS
jgi:hypothetical protein